LPGSGAGPSPDRMFIGSEGILGIITEAWVRLRRKPTFRAATSVGFKSFFAGADAVRGITQAGLYPANCRLLEAREALPDIPWDNEEAVLMLTFEPADHGLDARMARALEICRDCGGVPDAAALADENSHRSGAAGAWRNKFIGAPHYSEHAVARGDSLLDLRDGGDLGALARFPRQDHEDRPRHHPAGHRPRGHSHLPLHPRLSRRAVPLLHDRRHPR
jgi:alkyldihydroxyacetonephosphate synthase